MTLASKDVLRKFADDLCDGIVDISADTNAVKVLTEVHEAIGEMDFILGFCLGQLAKKVGFQRAEELVAGMFASMSHMGPP